MKNLLLVLVLFICGNYIAIVAVDAQLGSMFSLGHGTNIGVSARQNVSDKIILSSFVAILLSKVFYDVFWHSAYAITAHAWSLRLLQGVECHNIESVEQAAQLPMFDQMTRDEILIYELWLRGSYGCWLTPWNWTLNQKNSYNMVQMLAIIVLHGELISFGSKLTGADVIACARGTCTAVSVYPLMYYGYELDKHIEFIKNDGLFIGNKKLFNMMQHILTGLHEIKYLLRQEKEFINEIHMFKTHQLLQEIRTTNNTR